ncbi:MAG: ATP-binding protein [Pseudonocardia sp.]|nr:ATP-binding protein [Pseudonocardia sp.]
MGAVRHRPRRRPRRRARRVARHGAADLVLAVNELAANAVEHGAGTGALRLWVRGGEVVTEVSDHGGGMAVPFPGIVLPPVYGARGRGLWPASELCDVMQVWSGEDGTVIRVQLGR